MCREKSEQRLGCFQVSSNGRYVVGFGVVDLRNRGVGAFIFQIVGSDRLEKSSIFTKEVNIEVLERPEATGLSRGGIIGIGSRKRAGAAATPCSSCLLDGCLSPLLSCVEKNGLCY